MRRRSGCYIDSHVTWVTYGRYVQGSRALKIAAEGSFLLHTTLETTLSMSNMRRGEEGVL